MPTFEQYEAAVPDLRPNGLDFRGTCPSCGGNEFSIRIYGPHDFEPVCPDCRRPKIDAAVRKAINGNGHVHTEEPRQAAPPPPPPPPDRKKPAARKIRGYTAAEILAMDLEEPKWAIPGIVCEGLTILAGGQKLGKSWLALAVAIAIACGGKAFGKIDVREGDVLYLALEDTIRRLKDRLEKLLQGEPAPRRLTVFTEWPKLDEEGLGWLRNWLEQHKQARLVIIDTLKKVRPPRGRNGFMYDEDYDFMGELKALADEFSIAILVLHHVRKATAEDIFDTVSGSIGLTGAADATLVLTRARGRKDGLLHLTGRDVEEKSDEDAMALEWSAETGGWTLLGTAAVFALSEERRQIIELLELAARPLSAKEISDMLNKNYNTMRVILLKMTQQGQVCQEKHKYTPINTINSVVTRHENEASSVNSSVNSVVTDDERGEWWR